MIMRVVLTTGLKLTMRARLRVNGKLSAPADTPGTTTGPQQVRRIYKDDNA